MVCSEPNSTGSHLVVSLILKAKMYFVPKSVIFTVSRQFIKICKSRLKAKKLIDALDSIKDKPPMWRPQPASVPTLPRNFCAVESHNCRHCSLFASIQSNESLPAPNIFTRTATSSHCSKTKITRRIDFGSSVHNPYAEESMQGYE